jgi:hypothetical protein
LQQTIIYIYHANIIIFFVLFLLLFIFFFKTNYFAAYVVAINLLRPDERFALPFSYIKIILISLILSMLMNNQKLTEYKYSKENKIIGLYVMFIMLLTIIFHREDLWSNIMRCVLGFLLYTYVTVFISSKKDFRILCYFVLVSAFLICFEPFYYHCT